MNHLHLAERVYIFNKMGLAVEWFWQLDDLVSVHSCMFCLRNTHSAGLPHF